MTGAIDLGRNVTFVTFYCDFVHDLIVNILVFPYINAIPRQTATLLCPFQSTSAHGTGSPRAFFPLCGNVEKAASHIDITLTVFPGKNLRFNYRIETIHDCFLKFRNCRKKYLMLYKDGISNHVLKETCKKKKKKKKNSKHFLIEVYLKQYWISI